MKLSLSLTTLLFIGLLSVSCSQSTTDISTKVDEAPISNQDTDMRKFKPTKEMVAIDGLRSNFTVKVGQQVYYSARVHGSVGYTAEVYSQGSGLNLSDNFTEYDKKQEAGMTGGDAATEYFIFDALEVGTFTVIAKRFFRGNLENESTITINIE